MARNGIRYFVGIAVALVGGLLVLTCDSTTGSDPCAHIDCSSRGFCIVEQGEPECACIIGYHAVGLDCVINDPTDPCQGVDCSGHGACRNAGGSPVCDCALGYAHPLPGDPRCSEFACDLLCVEQTAADADADAPAEAETGADADVPDDGVTEVPVTCGNGAVDPGEECDDANPIPADGCETDCRFTCHAAADCADGNQCTTDACAAGGTGQLCSNSVAEGLGCDDGDECTTGESCNDAGVCGNGTSTCACRTDTDCAAYEDGDACNGTLVCADGRCLVDPVTIVTCDTSGDTPCRHNECNSATGACAMVSEPDGTACNDGLFCSLASECRAGTCASTAEACPASGCVAGCNEATDSCTPASSSTVCRASTGGCDTAETCTGSSTACPADGFASPSTACRAAAPGGCDVAENCTGSSAACPADGFRPAGYSCRAGAGTCDVAETCSGSSASCPADGYAPPSTVCRSAVAGGCDVAENCTGTSAACPTDRFASAATICRTAGSGGCDVAETCTGTTATCPVDAFASALVVCRDNPRECDARENCTGTSATCPADLPEPDGTACGTCRTCASGACTGYAAAGSDPGDDCSLITCTNYLYGWSGASCVRYSGSSANNGMCNSTGACASVTESCTGVGAAVTNGTCFSIACRNNSVTSPCRAGLPVPVWVDACDYGSGGDEGPCYCDCLRHGCLSGYMCNPLAGRCLSGCV